MPDKWPSVEEMRETYLNWKIEPLVFEVEKGAIRRFAYCAGDANPLWIDEQYAKKSKYGGITAPCVFLEYFNPRQWGAPDPPRHRPIGASAGNAYEVYHPIKAGDVLTVAVKYIDVYEKVGRSGPLVFAVDEKTYTNQDGLLIAKSHWTSVNWGTQEAVSKTSWESIKPPPRFQRYVESGDRRIKIEQTYPTGQQNNFEDVKVGMELPALTRELSAELFVRYFAASNDWGTHHFDYLFAASRGWKDQIAEGLLGTTYLCKVMTDWMGLEGFLRKLDTTYRAPGYPDDIWTCKGRVTSKYEKDGEHLVDCELWVENQDGAVATRGSGTVALPSRG